MELKQLLENYCAVEQSYQLTLKQPIRYPSILMLTLPDRYKFDKNNNVFFVLDKELISVPLVYTCRKVSKDMLENDFKTTLQFCQFFFINGQNGWII